MRTKKLLLPILSLFCLVGMATAAPKAGGRKAIEKTAIVPPVKYQAVLRDARGYVRADETLTLTLELRQEGAAIYTERHTVTTDALGQIYVYLGTGTPVNGRYDSIDWSIASELRVSDGNTELVVIPVTAVPTALYAYTAHRAAEAATALSAKEAETAAQATAAETAQQALTAQELEGKVFDDNQTPASHIYYSASKMLRMFHEEIEHFHPDSGSTDQTAILKEAIKRKEEDLRLWDSLMAETQRRLTEDRRLWDSLADLRQTETADLRAVLDSLTAERKKRLEADVLLGKDIEALEALITLESDSRIQEEKRLLDSLAILQLTGKANLRALLDSLAIERQKRISADGLLGQEDLRLWDSIGKVAGKEQNVCEANDQLRGIHTAPIPVEKLFSMPEMKILKQSKSCDLFTGLTAVAQLKRSYKTRVLVSNATGNSTNPTSVRIPAGNSLVDVYVDNFRISAAAEYLTRDVLVFEVEYYLPTAAGGKGKMYVTLVRE